jgi:hypothetical protein
MEETQYDTLGAIIAVNDYMYAMAMKFLGCPDIPESFGSDMQNAIKKIAGRAEFDMKKNDFNDTSVDICYEEQRGKNAKELIIANADAEKLIAEKKALPIRVAQYAGEYFALKKRQEGHGKWWIFFHKKENEARTTLLANMKKTLQAVLNEGDDIDKLDPVKIAEIYSPKNIESRANELFQKGIANRNEIPAGFIEYKPTTTERADKERREPNKAEIEFEAEMRMPLEFGDDAFKESKPIRMAYVSKVNDKIVTQVVTHNDGDKEVDLSNYQLKL